MKRLVLAACTTLALAFPGLGMMGRVAHADTGGATVVHQSQCQDFNGLTYCVTLDVESNQTSTPSGTFRRQQNGTGTFTFSSQGQTVFSEEDVVHFQALYKNGTLQELGAHDSFCFTPDNQSSGLTYDFHYANGMVQYFILTPGQSC